MNTLLRTMVSVAFFLQPVISDAATKFACPAAIQIDEKLKQTYQSWSIAWARTSGPERYPLDQMRVYSGHPDGGGNLKPDGTVHSKEKLLTTWTLPQPEPDGYWLACTYENSTALLVRALPPKLKRCQLREKSTPRGVPIGIESFVCD